MATFKVVMTFNGNQGEIFSDVFYREASDLGQATTLSPEFIAARLKMLDNSNTFRSYRVSSILGNRQAQTIAVNKQGNAGTANDVPPATPGVAAVMQLATTTGGSRKWWLRGFPQFWLQQQLDTGLPHWRGNDELKTFMGEAAKAAFGVLKLAPLVRNPDTFPPIVSIAPGAAAGTSVLTLANNSPGIDKNERIIISGVNRKNYPGLAGSFLVQAKDGLTFTIKYQMPPYGVFPTPGGKVRQEKYTQPIAPFDPAKCAFAYANTHKTKNPFDNTRGRRSAVRIRESR